MSNVQENKDEKKTKYTHIQHTGSTKTHTYSFSHTFPIVFLTFARHTGPM